MDFDIYKLFDFLKNDNYDKFETAIDYILDNKLTIDDIDLNSKDDNNIYLINYLVIANNYKILEKLFQIENIKIDILDNENRSILNVPIKYNYKKLFDLLLKYNKNIIGISICDIKDQFNNIALHYAIKNKNIYFIDELLKYGSNIMISDKNGFNALHMAIYSRNCDIVNLILKYSQIPIIINSKTNSGETPLHFAVNLQEIKIVKLLLKNGADINSHDYEHEYNILHYAINLSSRELVKICLEYNIDINHQDIYGNTALHYVILENNLEIFNMLISNNYKINVNLWNLEGKLPLHMLFKNSSNMKKDIIDYLVEHSNLNIQDNEYNSCLHLLCYYEIWENYDSILRKKKLDIFIKNNKDKRPIDYIKKEKLDKFINIVVESYLYNLEIKKENIWDNEWENICKTDLELSNEQIKELKKVDIKINNKKNKKDNCRDIIRKKLLDIIEMKDGISCITKSFPIKRGKMCIKIDDNMTNLQYCTFTGSTLDVIIGLIYLLKKHRNTCATIPANFHNNNNLCSTYKSMGIAMGNNCEFLNFEIIWANNKIHFVENMDRLIEKCLVNTDKRFIIMPLGIELNQGSHANYIILDKVLREVERFEPYGSGSPYGFNYNSDLLDKILEKKFKEIYEIKSYIPPKDFLPKISLQMMDVVEKKKKKIGDPGGFCALWSIFYTDMRITYQDIPRKKLIKYIINLIKKQNLSYKNIIRNYSYKIIEIRDALLNTINLDINDWLNDNVDSKQFELLSNEITSVLNKLI